MSQNRIGLIQMTSGNDVDDNLHYLETKIAELASQGCRVIVTPENCVLFADADQYRTIAEDLGTGPIQNRLSELANRYSIWLIVGSLPTRTKEGKFYSTCLVFNDQGQLVEHYHKMHLFDVDVEDEHKNYRESDLFKHGSQIKLVDTPVGRVGLSICYDLRFANLYNLLRNANAEVIIVPAAFTAVTGEAHWETLLRARAIENQVWIVGVGQCGYHSYARQTWGHSMVVDPWGVIVSKAAMTPSTITADIDLDNMRQVRQSMPVASHQKINSLINNNE